MSIEYFTVVSPEYFDIFIMRCNYPTPTAVICYSQKKMCFFCNLHITAAGMVNCADQVLDGGVFWVVIYLGTSVTNFMVITVGIVD